MEQPVKYWVPSIAPSGMAFYSGTLFPAWRGNMLAGALRDQMLVRLTWTAKRSPAKNACCKASANAFATYAPARMAQSIW